MWQRVREGRSGVSRSARSADPRRRRRTTFHPCREVLEGRTLLTASLATITVPVVPARQGYVAVLDGGGTPDPQTFTATSSNPDVAAVVVQGPFLTFNVQYTDPSNAQNDFSGPLTFQLFQNLTPDTAARIAQFAASGGYNGTQVFRVVNDFSGAGGPTDVVIQGGPQGQAGSGTNPLELKQALAFLEPGALAIANAGAGTDGQQFFVTAGAQPSLEYNTPPFPPGYTFFGQLVSGGPTLAEIGQVPVHMSTFGENSTPNNPVTITTATLSTTNPNGVLVLDTTQAAAGETATVTVTATDSVDHTTVKRTFGVTVGDYTGPTDPGINFRPLATPASAATFANAPTTVTLHGQSGYPDASRPASLSYAIASGPGHGTVSQFNAAAGTFVYTPAPGFFGTDTFQYVVQSTGPVASPAALASNPTAVTVTVAPLASVVGSDFNGDGKTDLAVYRPSTGQWIIQPSGTSQTLVEQFGDPANGDTAVPGDYDGVGHTELAVFRPAADQWLIQGPNGLEVRQLGDPAKGDVPAPGDFNGDGKTDLAVYRPSTGQWIIRLSGTNQTVVASFGDPTKGDVPVPGDYDGVGHTELAVFRPSTAQWLIQGPNGLEVRQFGDPAKGDVPAPGAYDGTGKTTLAVFRPSTYQWIIPGASRTTVVRYGDKASGDVPVEAPYQIKRKLEGFAT